MNEILNFDNLTVKTPGFASPFAIGTVSLRKGDFVYLPKTPESAVLSLVLGGARVLSGTGTLLGYPLVGLSGRRQRELLRRIGIVSEDQTMIAGMSLYDFLALPLKIADISLSQISRRIRALLGELDLTLQSARLLGTLSDSDRRLATFAQALIKSPALIICDLRMDDFDRSAIIPLLRKYARHGGTVLVFAESPFHNPEYSLDAKDADIVLAQ